MRCWMYGALSLKYFPPSPVTHLCQWVFAAASTSLDEHVSAPALLPFEIKNYWLCILWRIWGGGILGSHLYCLQARLCSCEKAPVSFVVSVHWAVYPHVSAQISWDRFLWNLVLGTLWKSVKKIQIWLNSGQKYQAFYNKTQVQFVVAGNLKFPYSCSLGMTRYHAVRI